MNGKVFISIGVAMLVAVQVNAATRPDTPSEIAACMVDNDATDVRKLLDTMPGSPSEAVAAKPILEYYGGCNDNKAVSGALAWRDRAEIANAALIKRMGKKSFDIAAASQPGWALEIGAGKTPGTDYDAAAAGTRMFGDCIVRAALQAAVDLARSAPGGVAEKTAIDRLSIVLAPCVPAGQNMKVKRADLRLLVAEPLYHLMAK
ncbi:MAG: hypothetical protein J0J06_06640 [Sphingomonas sp.]|uniref:hypothetical protein n=1 Tax=Sphingomonas sp. TaxID=28214 RepID=UPI001AC0ECC5|nr:hypothetical protein [Sphingomonas sp.]MBN8815108.1 hypothetical protein [Sphingomonas sp.]